MITQCHNASANTNKIRIETELILFSPLIFILLYFLPEEDVPDVLILFLDAHNHVYDYSDTLGGFRNASKLRCCHSLNTQTFRKLYRKG